MIKFVVLSAIVTACYGAAVYNGDPKLANIIRSDVDIAPDGQYQYILETENGISAAQQGVPKQFEKSVAVVAQGSYQYVSPDGGEVKIEYVADENGYQPTGNVLPVPPAIPKHILRLLEYIATHPVPQEKPERP